MFNLILASASLQRKKLLEEIGIKFSVIPSSIDESICTEDDPIKRAQILAKMKAQDIALLNSDSYVLGADTLVVSETGTLLEKPVDENDARRMMKEHSGTKSIVYSAICLVDPSGKIYEALDTSILFFKELTDEDIEWWIESNLWQGRSGAFQIEGKGQLLIEKLEGDWSGVVGLPIFILGKLLDNIHLVHFLSCLPVRSS